MQLRTTDEFQLLVNSLSKLLLAENISVRDSMSRIDSLLKDAVQLLDESELLIDQTKVFELKKVINKLTRIYQVEDIVSQIVGHVVRRSLAIDEAVEKLKNIISHSDKEIDKNAIIGLLTHIQELNDFKNTTTQSTLDEGNIELF